MTYPSSLPAHNEVGPVPALCSFSLFDGAGVWAGGALLAGVSVGAGLGTLTAAAHAGAMATAHQPIAGHAGVSACGAVAVVSCPV